MKISRFYEKVKKNFRFDITKCKETSKVKTENLFLLKKAFIWSKMYRVDNNSVNMGVVEIQVGNFIEKEQLLRNFRATCGQG